MKVQCSENNVLVLALGGSILFNRSLKHRTPKNRDLGKASKNKKCKSLDIVQTGGRGGKEVGCNVQTFLNVEQEKKWPKTAEVVDK